MAQPKGNMATREIHFSKLIPKFIGKENISVYARGTLGQLLFIPGTDKWTGGLGVTQADEVFGGLDIGGSWSVWSGSYGVISSRYLRIWGATACHHSTTANATSTNPCLVEFESMIDSAAGTAAVGTIGFRISTSSKAVQWKFYTTSGVLYCQPSYYDTGAHVGTAIAITAGQIYRFKIVLKNTGYADYYLNGALQESLDTNNENVDFKADVYAAAGYTIFTKRVRMLYGS